MKPTTITEPYVLRLATEIADRAKIPLPRLWLDRHAPENGAWCISLRRGDADVYLPAALLDRGEWRLRPVLAHEFGHLAAGHPVLKGLARMALWLFGGILAFACLPVAVVYAGACVLWVWPALSMACEYDADRRAVGYLGDPSPLMAFLIGLGMRGKSRLRRLAKACSA